MNDNTKEVLLPIMPLTQEIIEKSGCANPDDEKQKPSYTFEINVDWNALKNYINYAPNSTEEAEFEIIEPKKITDANLE